MGGGRRANSELVTSISGEVIDNLLIQILVDTPELLCEIQHIFTDICWKLCDCFLIWARQLILHCHFLISPAFYQAAAN